MTQPEPVPFNPAYATAGVYLRWRKANGPLPAALVAPDAEATSTTTLLGGDLLLKRGLMDAAMFRTAVAAIRAGKIVETDVMTPEEAAAALRE